MRVLRSIVVYPAAFSFYCPLGAVRRFHLQLSCSQLSLWLLLLALLLLALLLLLLQPAGDFSLPAALATLLVYRVSISAIAWRCCL